MNINEQIEKRKKEFILNNVSHNSFIKEMCIYGVQGGKNLRGKIILNEFLKRNEQLFYNFFDICIAIEYVHAASIILDDLPFADNTSIRRGRDAFHIKYGVANSQLISFILISLSNLIIYDLFNSVVASSIENGRCSSERIRSFSSYINSVINKYIYSAKGLPAGQIYDLNSKLLIKNKEDYFKSIKYKTSRLFQVCYILPYIFSSYYSSNELEESKLNKLKRLGKIEGYIFQLKDDLNDKEEDFKQEITKNKNGCFYFSSTDEVEKLIESFEQEIDSIKSSLDLD